MNEENQGIEENQNRKKIQEKYKKLKFVLQAIVFSLIPIMAFFLMEYYEHNPWKEVRETARFFNILLFEMLAWMLFFLLKKAKYALQLLLMASMLFGLINHYVMKFRSTPFVPWDLFSVKTAASVAGNYDFSPEKRGVWITLAFVAIILGLCFWNFQWRIKFPFRLVGALLVGVSLVEFGGNLQMEEFQYANYLYPFLFTPAYMTKVNGMAVTFVMDLAYVAVERPAGYKRERAQECLQQYEVREEKGETGDYPNIIVIMDEAFSDLSVLGKFPVSQDYMPFLHQMQKGNPNTITGNAQVSVCGGNTANSEFEFLTGNTMAFLPAGSIPYQQYIKGEVPTMVTYLKELGYETYAQHPYQASGWDREKVYPNMGFQNMAFKDQYRELSYLRSYISDATSFEKIIETYENKPAGKPAFIFNVTMQNHGGYTDSYENFTPDTSVIGVESPALEQYLSLLKVTDQELEKLIRYFAQEEEKTILVFFGDHQPSDGVVAPLYSYWGENMKELSEDEREKRYQVPYLIWANYDIESQELTDTSLNYLGAAVLKVAGVPTSDYQNYLLELQKKYPVISASKRLDFKEQEIDTYRKLQYYRLFDWEE